MTLKSSKIPWALTLGGGPDASVTVTLKSSKLPWAITLGGEPDASLESSEISWVITIETLGGEPDASLESSERIAIETLGGEPNASLTLVTLKSSKLPWALTLGGRLGDPEII